MCDQADDPKYRLPETRPFDFSFDSFSVFSQSGHLTEEVMLVRARAHHRLSRSQEDAIHAHVMACEHCRGRWNEYYEEWLS